MVEGFKNTEVGNYPLDWFLKPLGRYVKIASGESPSKFSFSEEGVPYFKVEQLNNDDKYANKTKYRISTTTNIPKGSIIFPKRGASIFLNKIRILSEDSYMDTNLMTLTVLDLEVLDYEYLFYQLSHIGLSKIADTTSIPQINNKHINPFILPLPPTKAEQTAIATALNDADALIQKLEQLIVKKRNIKTGAMQELLKPKEGWEESILTDECALITKGTTPTSVGRDFQNSGINFIKIESLTESGKIIKDKVACIDNYTHSLLKRSQLKSGDALFSIAGALGRVALVSEDLLPANTNQALAIIRLKKDSKINLRYLFYFLNERKIQNHILAINVQGAQANLSLLNIAEFIIEHPCEAEQSNIAQILTDLDNEINELEKQLEKYRMMKQGMMKSLLTGKIRLNQDFQDSGMNRIKKETA